jgi:hypothetical protein
MSVYYSDDQVALHLGDALDVAQRLPDCGEPGVFNVDTPAGTTEWRCEAHQNTDIPTTPLYL